MRQSSGPKIELENEAIRNEAEGKVEESTCDVRDYLNPDGIKLLNGLVTDMYAAYYRGDEMDVEVDPVDDADAIYRNKLWMPKLVETLTQRRAYVAVGVLHLMGPDGLLQLLKAQGFQVRRLSADPGDAPGAGHPFQR